MRKQDFFLTLSLLLLSGVHRRETTRALAAYSIWTVKKLHVSKMTSTSYSKHSQS